MHTCYFRYSGLGGLSDKKTFLPTLEEGKKLAPCVCWEEGSIQGKRKYEDPRQECGWHGLGIARE